MHTINKQKTIQNVILYGLLLIGGVFSVLPMIYMISTSLKPNGALYEYPPHFFPKLSQITLENYVYIFNQEKFYLNFLNSLVVAILTIVFAAIIASALAFCIARFRFPGRKLLFALVIGTMIIPGTTLIITQYQLATYFKLTNKLLGLVPFYVAWVIPFSTFMIKNYIESIPRDFDEAVYVDGGSIFTVFFRIVMPLAIISVFNNGTSNETRAIPLRAESSLAVGTTLTNLLDTSVTATVEAGGITGKVLNLTIPAKTAWVFTSDNVADYAPPARTVTTIRVHYDVGLGNTMYLRGSDYPLTWDSGRSMLNVSSDVWVYETERIGKGESFELKPLINDTTWSSGNNYTVVGGETIDIYPNF